MAQNEPITLVKNITMVDSLWDISYNIDTGVPHTTSTTTIRCKFTLKNNNSDRYFGYHTGDAGCLGDSNDFRPFMYMRGSFDYGTARRMFLGIAEPNTYYDLTVGDCFIYDNINGQYLLQSSTQNTVPSPNCHIVVDVSCLKVEELVIQDGNTVLFNGHAAYDNIGNVGLYDSVSDELKYNPDLSMTYEAIVDPLCFTAKQSFSSVWLNDYGQNSPTIYYSLDNENWTLWDYSPITLEHVDDVVYFYGDNPNGFSHEGSISSFGMSGIIEASGDVTSLITHNGTNTIPNDFCFHSLFENCTSLTSGPYLRATTLTQNCYDSMFYGCEHLLAMPSLPATTLADGCYRYMFYGCELLTDVPDTLPATTLAYDCYNSMFANCTSLTSAPALPATTLTASCYHGMFYGCTSLTTPPALPATTLAFDCYNSMFFGCTSLATAPVLPATTMAQSCYQQMFQGCTSITTPPSLPATTLALDCYTGMFVLCSSLTTAPELPATTLADGCYNMIFYFCTSLTTAPELPATTLTNQCYRRMFQGCSNLVSVTIPNIINWTEENAENWLLGVAEHGTVYCNSECNIPLDTANGVPTGWVKYQPQAVATPTITGVDNTEQCSDGSTIHTGTGTVTITDETEEAVIYYSIDNGEWMEYSIPIQLTTGTYIIKSYATKVGMADSDEVDYEFTVSEEEECQHKPVRLRIVDKLVHILEDMVADTASNLASFQYNSIAKGNVRLDAKMANPTALLVQITDWSLDLTNMTKREAVEVSLFFLDKETKIDNEALAQEVIIKNMADIACDFLSRLMADKSLRIVDEKVKIKSVFYQSDSNRDGVCLQMRIEERGGSCLS